jgi:geranylgeranyl diphosphate synthase type II
MPTAAAFEMVHTYSLIHDDLPAMDNDDLRRGRPTNHKVYGEALGILAGDALLTRAFEVIARFTPMSERVAALVCELARGAGAAGMVLGQVADLAGESLPPHGALVEYIHRHKTGALFVTSIRAGAIAGGASAKTIAAFTRYGEALGLAFQIVDDVLDQTSTAEAMGKATGKDSGAGKQTWPTIHGLDASRTRASELVSEARAAIAEVGNPLPLIALADFFENRKH